MSSFTQRVADLTAIGPVIEIELSRVMRLFQVSETQSSAANSLKVLAMIDSGASGTVIRKGIAAILGLKPVGTTSMYTPSSADVLCEQFFLQITFPERIIAEEVLVTEAPLQGQHIQCLIGRDVLRYAVFNYNGFDNSFTLSFEE